jgi:hypothetical protein
VTDERLCPYCGKPLSEGHCKACGHEDWFHSKLRVGNITIVQCDADNQFVCGCPGEGNALLRTVCNVCGKDFGNATCLADHLNPESMFQQPHCDPAKYVPEYYSKR